METMKEPQPNKAHTCPKCHAENAWFESKRAFMFPGASLMKVKFICKVCSHVDDIYECQNLIDF